MGEASDNEAIVRMPAFRVALGGFEDLVPDKMDLLQRLLESWFDWFGVLGFDDRLAVPGPAQCSWLLA